MGSGNPITGMNKKIADENGEFWGFDMVAMSMRTSPYSGRICRLVCLQMGNTAQSDNCQMLLSAPASWENYKKNRQKEHPSRS